jgi:hypothetical protein
VIWSAVEIVSGVLVTRREIRGRWELSGPRKTRQQGKLIVLARILVQAYAAKKILETRIGT